MWIVAYAPADAPQYAALLDPSALETWRSTGLPDNPGAWLATVLGQSGSATSSPFPGFYAPSGYYVVLLEVFAILVFACAVAAEYLGTIFERLHAHVAVARAEAERSQEFWTTLIEQLPTPALLVDADTMQIVCASARASRFHDGESVAGQNLFEHTTRRAMEFFIERIGPYSYEKLANVQASGLGGGVALRLERRDVRIVDCRSRRDLGGFYLQEEGSDQDDNALTSEGVFVFEGTGAPGA